MNYENQNFPYFRSKAMYNSLPERQIKKVYHDISSFQFGISFRCVIYSYLFNP